MDTALVLERETGHWNYFMSCQTFQVLFVAGGRGEETSYPIHRLLDHHRHHPGASNV